MLGLSPGQRFTRGVDDAVRRVQSRLGIAPDGSVDTEVATWLGEDVPLLDLSH
jgi:murein L,D-transpeptidase YcbB/YkuD